MDKQPDEVIKAEPMFFSSSLDFAYDHGGVITRQFIDRLVADLRFWKNSTGDRSMPIFDSRVHMLMPGWCPAIPGWHHDDVPRSRSDRQPNYIDPEYLSEHVMATVNGQIAPTYGISGLLKVNEVPLGQTIYNVWHNELTEQITNGIIIEHALPTETLIQFDWQFFHRASKAVSNGWRWFGRVSINTDRKITNEMRNQVQVYLENPTEGW